MLCRESEQWLCHVLKQNPTPQISANGWFVTMLSGVAYRTDLRAIVVVTMQWRGRRQNEDP